MFRRSAPLVGCVALAFLLSLAGCPEDQPPPADPGPSPPAPEAPADPPFYPAHVVHSPINSAVYERLRALYESNPSLDEHLFMKVGASSTVSANNFACFGGTSFEITEATEGGLEAWEHFRPKGTGKGIDPFARETEAAQVGWRAANVIAASDGESSALQREFEALMPHFALVHYGTNEMGSGAHAEGGLPEFYESMEALLLELESYGVISLLVGIMHRGDSEAAEHWVPTYNAVIRGLAQSHSLPFIDLWEATNSLPDYGLAGDGIHPNAYSGGACMLTPDGLEFGYNRRNSIQLEALWRVLLATWEYASDGVAPDVGAPGVAGSGQPDDPYVIHTLPFSHGADTFSEGSLGIDEYTGCSSSADESGPELLYRLELKETTAVRALVLDSQRLNESGELQEVDIDIHLLDETASAEGCVERDNRLIERTLDPGVWYFSLDSWVNSAAEVRSGRYLFVILECSPDDVACD